MTQSADQTFAALVKKYKPTTDVSQSSILLPVLFTGELTDKQTFVQTTVHNTLLANESYFNSLLDKRGPAAFSPKFIFEIKYLQQLATISWDVANNN